MERPGVVTFVGVLVLIKSGISLVIGSASFLARGSEQAAQAGLSDDTLLVTAASELFAALLLFFVAWYLLVGRSGARFLVALVIGLRLMLTVWTMLTHDTSAISSTGLISAAFSLFILWSLYGNERSKEYFEAPHRTVQH
jgi:small-conductance mechanosensitive channel